MPESFKYLILPEARVDFRKAAIWYGDQNKALPKRFKSELKRTITSITVNPFVHAIRYADIRIAVMKVFPFGVHYRIDELTKLCLIVGIYHEASNPENWIERLTP